MLMRKKYQSPCVLKTETILPEIELLSGSVVDTSTIKSVGQEVETYDFSDPEFNHTWED